MLIPRVWIKALMPTKLFWWVCSKWPKGLEALFFSSFFHVQTQTQEIRKRKEMEHEMLSNPVKGFNGSVRISCCYGCTDIQLLPLLLLPPCFSPLLLLLALPSCSLLLSFLSCPSSFSLSLLSHLVPSPSPSLLPSLPPLLPPLFHTVFEWAGRMQVCDSGPAGSEFRGQFSICITWQSPD